MAHLLEPENGMDRVCGLGTNMINPNLRDKFKNSVGRAPANFLDGAYTRHHHAAKILGEFDGISSLEFRRWLIEFRR